MMRQLVHGRRRCVPAQLQPRRAMRTTRQRFETLIARHGEARPGTPDRHSGRPARPQAAGRNIRRRPYRAGARPGISTQSGPGPRRRSTGHAATSRDLCGTGAGHRTAARRRQAAPGGRALRSRFRRDAGGGGRQAVRAQGRQRARRRIADLGTDRTRIARPGIRRWSWASTGLHCPSCSAPRTLPRRVR